MNLKDKIDINKLPKHIAIIMDGNGRWAQKHGMERIFGHQNGVTAVRETAEAAAELGVQYVTLYAFSTENWKRPRMEVDALMQLLVSTIHNEISTLNDNNIRLQAIGDISSLQPETAQELMRAIKETENNSRMTLVLALSYGSRWEITQAVKAIVNDVQTGKLNADCIGCESISNRLYTSFMPDPELLIRTSGEFRISNFLLWQLAYAEFYFTPKLWPDFRKDDLYAAIIDFQSRERRFGKTGEQLRSDPS
jgi:undecaprenyl diphosphate synthase